MVRLMRKRICFLSLGTQLLSSFLLLTPLSAMDNSPDISAPPLSNIHQIRQHYHLPPSTGSSSQIPQIIRTGRELAREASPSPLPPIDLQTLTFETLLENNPFTPLQIDTFLPLDEWDEFLNTVRTHGKKLKVQINSGNNALTFIIDDKNEQSVQVVLQQQAKWHLVKVFIQKLQRAIEVIPSSLYEKCPASLIVKQGFSKYDSIDVLALKYQRLGLDINGLEDQISFTNRHFLMGEVFKLAGDYFFSTAHQSQDPFAKPDLYLSSAICLGWSAIHGDSTKVDTTLKAAQEAMHTSYQTLSQAYKYHREVMAQINDGALTDYKLDDLIEIKKQLIALPSTLVSWSKKFDPEFYHKKLEPLRNITQTQ